MLEGERRSLEVSRVAAGEAGVGLGVPAGSSSLASAACPTRKYCVFLNGRETAGEGRGKRLQSHKRGLISSPEETLL